MKVLIYSNEREPITAFLLKHKEQFGIFALSIQMLLEDVTIFDEIVDGAPKVNWRLPDGMLIQNDEQTLVINRIFGCPESLFSNFIKGDHSYAQSEFHAYLVFVLNAFRKVTNTPGSFSLTGGFYPLLRQWARAVAAAPGLQVPKYYLGDPRYLPNSLQDAQLIYSDIYSYYNWEPNECSPDTLSCFAFSRPKGIPCLVSILGQVISIHSMVNSEPLTLTQVIKGRIFQYADAIRSNFGFCIGEALFFVDESTITFGMMHNIPLAATQLEDFEDRLMDLFDNRFEQIIQPVGNLACSKEGLLMHEPLSPKAAVGSVA